MKTALSFCLLLCLSFSECAPSKQETAPKQYSVNQFMDIVQINGGSFSPDETKIVYNSKATGIFNAYEIDLKTGTEKQLTLSIDNAIFSQSYFPTDDRVLYTSDKEETKSITSTCARKMVW